MAPQGLPELEKRPAEADRPRLPGPNPRPGKIFIMTHIFIIKTLSTTWMTPFDWLTSAMVIFAAPPA